MFRKFYPYEWAKNPFTIDYQKLYADGYRGIIFDIDNTLVPHGADSTPEVDAFIARLREIGFAVLFLSNNDEPRVKRFMKNMDALFVCDADKPKRQGYEKALSVMGLNKTETVCIGDQVFTDIYGANRVKIPCILVDYIRKKGETKIGIRRHIEQWVLWFYGHRKSCQHRLGDILTEK